MEGKGTFLILDFLLQSGFVALLVFAISTLSGTLLTLVIKNSTDLKLQIAIAAGSGLLWTALVIFGWPEYTIDMLIAGVLTGMLGIFLGLRSGFFSGLKSGNFESAFAQRITFRNQRSVSTLVVALAMGSIALGVAVMEISVSIVHGFKAEIQNKVVGFGSHIQVGNYLAGLDTQINPLDSDKDFVKSIDSLETVTSVCPYVILPAMLKSDETLEGIILKGVNKDYDWDFFEGALEKGTLPDLTGPKESKEVLISKKQANLLLLDVGDEALVYFFREKPRARKVVISGIYESGMEEFDAINIIGDMRMLQRIMRWDENQVAGFEVKLNSLESLELTSIAINAILPIQYEAVPINRIFPEIFDWLELQHQNVTAILGLMIFIAIVNMITVILILIIERTQTIGMLKALGLSNRRVKRIFIYNALLLILFGVVAGNVVGISLIWLQKTFGFITLDQESYFVKEVPVMWVWDQFFLINVGVVLICTLFMYLPTLVISRISPVRAIRFE